MWLNQELALVAAEGEGGAVHVVELLLALLGESIAIKPRFGMP
ncbi:hypothetical protein [Thiorhodovibrio winogradskyi]|nr:hypothetical protein [Thiorhodovibrio winogradskyi]